MKLLLLVGLLVGFMAGGIYFGLDALSAVYGYIFGGVFVSIIKGDD